MRKDVLQRKKLYDNYIISAYERGESVSEIAEHLQIKPQKVKHIAHLLGITKRWKHTFDSFVKQAQSIHGDFYDYSKVEYKGVKTKVCIICPKHGEFWQTPHMHISKKMQGCPKCNVSAPHRKLITFLDNLKIPYEVNNRTLLDGKELDIYFPEHSLAIEINGVFYHTLDKLEDKYYHYDKYKLCENRGISLLQFWDFEIQDNFDLVSSMILQRLQLVKHKVYARNTKVVLVDSLQYKDFLQKHHLEGPRTSGIKLGLLFQDRLIAVMGVTDYGEHRELDRFCTERGYIVVGGFSKLFKRIPKDKPIISYSFNRYSHGDVYVKNGFTLERENKTSLFYYHKNKLKNRNGFMKYKIASRLDIQNPENYTERQLASQEGALQVYDAGTKTWIYHN